VDDRVFGGAAQLRVTISVGVALARGTDDVTAEFLLEEADRSLYRSKEGGRNRISA
jgi:diguanylate cyclase (GGDEF)-like protein